MMLFTLLLSFFSLARAFPADYENAAASVYTRDNPIGPATQSGVSGQLSALLTCERYGAVSFGRAVLYNDLWNQPIGIGTQCTGRGVLPGSWFTKWSWAQASSSSQVISYANVELAVGRQPISSLATMRSVWHATYRGFKLSANVAFDIFVAPPLGGEQIEIMAWVKQYGSAGPISSTGSPIAEVNLPSGRWALWKGRNNYSRMDVYSFVRSDAKSPGPVSYNGDVLEFIRHLIFLGTIKDDWRLVKVGAGTEATTGVDCLFATSFYSLDPVRK